MQSDVELSALQGTHSPLTEVVCWTRMQAESGEEIKRIVERKEFERAAGNGCFFWGVGNAASLSTKELAAGRTEVDVVFSLIRSKPKPQDVNPTSVVLWQSYFDHNGEEHPLPLHVLVTSRFGEKKRSHYALMCKSTSELSLDEKGPSFDEKAYCNLGKVGGAIAPSQNTALAARKRPESSTGRYAINMRARLTGSYWVKLGRASVVSDSDRALIKANFGFMKGLGPERWIETVSAIRAQHSQTIL